VRCGSLTKHFLTAIVLGVPRLLERLVKLLGGSSNSTSPNSNQFSFGELLAVHFYQSTRGVAAYEDHVEELEDEDEGEEGAEEDGDEGEEEEEGAEDGEEEAEDGEEEAEDGEEEAEDGEEDGEEGEEDLMEIADEAEAFNGLGAAGIAGVLSGMLGAMAGGRAGAVVGGAVGALREVVGALGGGAGARGMLYNMDQELEALMDGTAQTLKALALSTYQVFSYFPSFPFPFS
jgi:hypothetical protein